jgi:hypothetical protein
VYLTGVWCVRVWQLAESQEMLRSSEQVRQHLKSALALPPGWEAVGNPFDTGSLPLNYSGNPGVQWRILQGYLSFAPSPAPS